MRTDALSRIELANETIEKLRSANVELSRQIVELQGRLEQHERERIYQEARSGVNERSIADENRAA
jgi:hypothetical protein